MLKKIFLIILSSLLVGCSSKQHIETIEFASWGSITEVNIIKKIISDFETENPNIKIRFIHIPENYFQKIHLLFASNTPPDILLINNLNLPIYEKYLEDLSYFIDNNEYFDVAIDSLTINKKLLAIPRDVSSLVLYINLNKIKLPKENWTLEDLFAIALKNTNENSFGLGHESGLYWLYPYLSYYSGGVLDNNLNYIFDKTNSIQALDFYNDLKHKYNIIPLKRQIGSLTLAQMFLDEKIAMYLSGRWIYPKISKEASFNWAVINFPKGNSKFFADSSGWAITKSAKNKTAVLKFLKHLSSVKNIEFMTSSGLIIPANIEAAKTLNSNEHNQQIFLDIIKNSTKTPVSKDYKKLTDEINLKYFN